MPRIQTDHIGMMIAGLISDHVAGCEEGEMPVFMHQADEGDQVPSATFETCEVDTPEGDHSNLKITLPSGETFRVQIFAR